MERNVISSLGIRTRIRLAGWIMGWGWERPTAMVGVYERMGSTDVGVAVCASDGGLHGLVPAPVRLAMFAEYAAEALAVNIAPDPLRRAMADQIGASIADRIAGRHTPDDLDRVRAMVQTEAPPVAEA